MSPDLWFVLITSTVACIAGIAFLIVYSYMAPWWSDHVGRMMATQAAALAALNAISAIGLASNADFAAIRIARSALTIVTAFMLGYQTRLVIKLQRKDKE